MKQLHVKQNKLSSDFLLQRDTSRIGHLESAILISPIARVDFDNSRSTRENRLYLECSIYIRDNHRLRGCHSRIITDRAIDTVSSLLKIAPNKSLKSKYQVVWTKPNFVLFKGFEKTTWYFYFKFLLDDKTFKTAANCSLDFLWFYVFYF